MKLQARSFLLLFSVLVISKATAQPIYTGQRVALFDVQILQQKNQQLNLRCRMSNTGRQTIGAKKNAAELVVEFDTIGLPSQLRGHESDIADAARNNCPKLMPGEVSEPIWLNVTLKSRANQVSPSGGCAELVFDTAFVEEWGERTMRIRYFLKNTGTAPAHFFAKNIEPQVNVFFVSGAKLTRGAIPAGNTSIQKGRETLDGLLLPGQILEGTIEIALKDRTRFSPNIALEFDPAQAVDECSRTGNVWVLKIRF